MSVVSLLGLLACGVGLLVAIPVVSAMRMVAYADVMGLSGPSLSPVDRMPVPSGGGYPPVPPAAGFSSPPSATPTVPPVMPVDPVNPFGDGDDNTPPPPPPIDLPR